LEGRAWWEIFVDNKDSSSRHVVETKEKRREKRWRCERDHLNMIRQS
jgi:hypothetical protein